MSDGRWSVEPSRKVRKLFAGKQKKKNLPARVREALAALISDLECFGPTLGPQARNWPNFGPISGKNLPLDSFHCHIKRGRPTYVACWSIENKKVKIIEVYYVGSHEKAPY